MVVERYQLSLSYRFSVHLPTLSANADVISRRIVEKIDRVDDEFESHGSKCSAYFEDAPT